MEEQAPMDGVSNGTRQRVVVVEDETEVRLLVLDLLELAQIDGVGVPSGEEGLALIQAGPCDLVLLDIGLPGALSGRDVLRKLREDPKTARLPIIVMTGQEEEQMEHTLLKEGADDFIWKSTFRPLVLVERIRAVLRRVTPVDTPTLRTEHLVVSPERREVLVDGKPVNLTPTEFDIVYRLASNPDRVLSRKELVDSGVTDSEKGARIVDVYVLSIRRKFGKYAWLISTVWGVGYRLGSGPGT
jgi:DNA-binding response OmpR family regulator